MDPLLQEVQYDLEDLMNPLLQEVQAVLEDLVGIVGSEKE